MKLVSTYRTLVSFHPSEFQLYLYLFFATSIHSEFVQAKFRIRLRSQFFYIKERDRKKKTQKFQVTRAFGVFVRPGGASGKSARALRFDRAPSLRPPQSRYFCRPVITSAVTRQGEEGGENYREEWEKRGARKHGGGRGGTRSG